MPLPNSVTTIESFAFYLCRLTSVHIPSNVSNIGEGAFAFNYLVEITVDSNNEIYHSTDNCVIDTSTKTLVLGCQNSIIPSDGSVVRVATQSFSGSHLTSLIIPNTITEIGEYAFSSCDLSQVIIPASVHIVGYAAFYLCDLTTILCEADSQPAQWSHDWNKIDAFPETYAEVIWGYTE